MKNEPVWDWNKRRCSLIVHIAQMRHRSWLFITQDIHEFKVTSFTTYTTRVNVLKIELWYFSYVFMFFAQKKKKKKDWKALFALVCISQTGICYSSHKTHEFKFTSLAAAYTVNVLKIELWYFSYISCFFMKIVSVNCTFPWSVTCVFL